ncbi:sporulation protein YtxC [Thalassobacillus pellis]|uniref:sporulation protein YtxC n=1 Tax=Thalassobacillus pellis TaxID=748008 RepID=UPI00195F2FAB|nr:sporulation protein YtxC [Thalassobacillus pellis]MBM7555003.1 putative sporulation protein YtxC [Thalassobacillus pellis]
MIRFFFLSRQETISFCDFVMQQGAKFQVQWKGDNKGGNQVALSGEEWDKVEKEILIDILITIVDKHRVPKWYEQLVRSHYYYQDPDEIGRILEICDWLNDAEQRRKLGVDLPAYRNVMRDFFHQHVHESGVVDFSGLMPFCLQSLRPLLLDYIGSAIDEFKREEDYQLWVESIRRYVAAKPPRVKELHLLQKKQFHFYLSNGKLLTKMEIKALLRTEPVRFISGDADDHSIAPTMIYVPEKLYIYGNDPSEPKIQTIINIFQEKAIYKPLSAFPFKHTSPMQ